MILCLLIRRHTIGRKINETHLNDLEILKIISETTFKHQDNLIKYLNFSFSRSPILHGIFEN